MNYQYIHIVGLPRTGTKLLQGVLENNEQLDFSAAGEIWFFGDLFRTGVKRRIKKVGDLKKDENVIDLVEQMYEGKGCFGRAYWNHLRRGLLSVDRHALLDAILASDRSEKTIYEILMRSRRPTAKVVGDKTPGNLYYVPEILSLFPNTKIIHTFRDPRAILASELEKKKVRKAKDSGASYSHLISIAAFFYIAITWLFAARLHVRYKIKYPRQYYLIRFEDLVTTPGDSVKNLCEFLEIPFSEAMLQPKKVDSSFDKAYTAGWRGFDRGALSRWQTTLNPFMKWWFNVLYRKYMKEFKYL